MDKSIVQQIENHWAENGFLYNLRYRNFIKDAGYDFLELLKGIDSEPSEFFNKKFIQLIWLIPSFLKARVEDFELSKILTDEQQLELKKLSGSISTEIERIIGHG